MSKLPFQLLELTVISAQDLAPVSKNMRTYAITWVHPDRKLRTRVDQIGHINPTWNDKFVFRVDNKFLDSESSSLMVEVYALGWLRDILIGSVRVLINNLVPSFVRQQSSSTRRFVALQIRRPSGRPQGILNMGVTLLDNTMRSMPLYMELDASAVGLHDLTDAKPSNNNNDNNNNNNNNDNNNASKEKARLYRSFSDGTDKASRVKEKKGSSLCDGSNIVGGSICYGHTPNGSMVNGSMINGSEVGGGNGSVCISDVGPSPSVVAAAVAKGLYPTPLGAPHKPGSSILGDWTVEESSVEGLKSKIKRWRVEFPPTYDSTNTYMNIQTPQKKKHVRSQSYDEKSCGLFTCFGRTYGCEFRIVCGAGNDRKHKSKHFSGSEI